MNKVKLILLAAAIGALSACTTQQAKKTQAQTGYLKNDISPAELANFADYKRYYYSCNNLESGETSFLSTYFPLSRESRRKENFGIYFQLDNGKAEPFDHIANVPIGSKRFEVLYRSYRPIQGNYIELIAREHRSTYYKNINGTQVPWLECREG